MPSSRDSDQSKLVIAVAEELKKKMEMPEWARYAKTGTSKERPPEQKDWWWMRAASILRKVEQEGPVGVQRLRSYYGGRKRHSHAPAHFRKASGKIIRTILINLEKHGLVTMATKPRKGRIATAEGKRILDKALPRKNT